MAEQIAPQIARDADKGETRYPARDPPQEIVGCDQRYEDDECQPYAVCVGWSRGKTVDEMFHAVLRAHGAGNGGNNGSEYDQMRGHALAKIAQHERDRTMRIA